MAFEIPDFVVAAAVIDFDPIKPLGQRMSLRNSVGIASSSETTFNTTASLLICRLEYPVAANEGLPVAGFTFAGPPPGGVALLAAIKGAENIGDANYDAAPLGSLMLGIDGSFPRCLAPLVVFRLPTKES